MKIYSHFSYLFAPFHFFLYNIGKIAAMLRRPGQGGYIMTKTDLISAVAEKTGVTKKDAGAILDALIEEIIGAVKKGDRVQLVGFGTFELRERAARTGLNPQTKEQIEIPASKAPAFKAGKAFKDAVK
jgi:DNA-binding protein HU-beta